MLWFYQYLCTALIEHNSSQCAITRGLVCFDPEVLTKRLDAVGKPAFDQICKTMVQYNWIELGEIEGSKTKNDTFTISLEV